MDHLTRLHPSARRRASSQLVRSAACVLVLSVVALAACGGSDGSDGAELSEAGARGQSVSRSNGCSGCHGTSGQGGVGPPWVGLYGSDVELDDGTTVVADEDYLARAISDPGAEKVKDASVVMPSNGLSDEEIADVIAYIRDLSPPVDPMPGSSSGATDVSGSPVGG